MQGLANQCAMVPIAFTLLRSAGARRFEQTQARPVQARSAAEEILDSWNQIGVLIRRVSGSNLGPGFGEGDNPSRDAFKTKANVMKFVQAPAVDEARVIQQQGDAGNLGIGWPTTPPSGRPPSSTAPSTIATLWSTIAPTIWRHRTRGVNSGYQ